MSLYLLWKEAGLGSQAKLAQLKRDLASDGRIKNRKGIGHSGTLDPFAEGILCVGIDEGTKVLSALVGLGKTYRAEIVLGATSLTLDPESDLEFPAAAPRAPSESKLIEFLAAQIGQHEQVPPQHSAVKVDGKRAYEHARKGQAVELKARSIEILTAQHLGLRAKSIDGHQTWIWTVDVAVTSGTYIRSLARDWGQLLVGHPGMLQSLVRTHLGPWQMEASENRRALQVADFAELLPTVTVEAAQAQALKAYGRWDAGWVKAPPGAPNARGYLVVAADAPGVPVALLTLERQVQRVFTSNPF